MITISLDEQGHFEDIKGEADKAPLFIAGVIYDDNGSLVDSANERSRIVNFLKAVCDSVDKKFPIDMHCNNYVPGKNARNVAIVKEALNKAIPEFIQNGTFKGAEVPAESSLLGADTKRQGKYYIFGEMKSSEGKEALMGKRVSKFVKDNYAGNLYVHMAESVVDRCIFHNPINRFNDVSFSLATRSVTVDKSDNEARSKYEYLGYKPLKFDNEDKMTYRVYQLTNPDFYRTAISRTMIENDRTDLNVRGFDVVSIDYKASAAGDMAFLYLSDIVCSILGFELKGTCPEEWLTEMNERSEAIAGKDSSMIFLYDVIDEYYKDALEAYEKGDLYRALSLIFDGLMCDSKFTDYYKNKWFELLLNRIKAVTSCSDYTIAVRKFRDAAHSNNLDQDKLLFVCEALSAMENTVRFPSDEDRAILYDLYENAAAALNHCGQSEKALFYLNKSKEYLYYFPLERYLDSLNKEVVSYCDQFKYDIARQKAERNLAEWEKIYSIRQELLGQNIKNGLGMKKAMSQLAQVYAFEHDERAADLFKRALQDSNYNDPNDLITLSYYLHLLIQMNDQDEFERNMALFLGDEFLEGKKSLLDQFKHIVRKGAAKKDSRFSMEFALLIFVKALYQFYLSEAEESEKLIKRLSDIETALDNIVPGASDMIDGHPWEIIYKYLALIMHHFGNDEKAEEYLARMDENAGEGNSILKAICLNGKKEYYIAVGDFDKKDEYEKLTIKVIADINENVSGADSESITIGKYITYMYR